MLKNCNCLSQEGFGSLGDKSVHLIVTSPPYWNIKDYDHDDQIGFGQSFEEYLELMNNVLIECHRALDDGCRFALNIGDQYLRASEHGRHRVLPIHSYFSIMGVEAGFDYMGAIIWNKISTTKTSGGGALMGSIYYPKDGHFTFEHEYY